MSEENKKQEEYDYFKIFCCFMVVILLAIVGIKWYIEEKDSEGLFCEKEMFATKEDLMNGYFCYRENCTDFTINGKDMTRTCICKRNNLKINYYCDKVKKIYNIPIGYKPTEEEYNEAGNYTQETIKKIMEERK
jgi:hypothetical protein